MKATVLPPDVPVLHETGIAVYLADGGPARLCTVIRLGDGCREARVQFWDETYPRWVNRRWLSPYLTSREQQIALAQRMVAS